MFVEPLEAIDLNNRLVQLGEDETAEIARILDELTNRVRAERGPLEAAAASIAHLDSIFARARFAREFDCVVPEFASGNSLRLEAARNPVLEATLRPQGRKAVPMSSRWAATETVMVISGPNTGGKTVSLKTVGLAALSAQSGIPVAAERAEMPVFDRVLADIGDEQSIAADLSTFSAHMLNLKSMLEVATDRSLILVDEMGTGTAPEEGAALAVALLEEFRARRAFTLATTHHDRLKAYASTTPGIVNAAMEFDEVNLRPTYRLLVGVPGTSSGIEIARRLGLPARVVDHAKASLSPESREARDLIAYLHRSRDEMEEITRQAPRRTRAARSGRAARCKRNGSSGRKNASPNWKRVFSTRRSGWKARSRGWPPISRTARCARRWKSRPGAAWGSLARTRARKPMRRLLKRSRRRRQDLGVGVEAPAKPVAPEELSAGTRVPVKGFKQVVVFRRHDGRIAEVEAGPLRMKVPLADIVAHRERCESGQTESRLRRERPRGITVHTQPSDEARQRRKST